jgi:hypothetical protein
MENMRRLWTFKAAVWMLGVIISLWLLGWPLVMNAWAGWRWAKTECHTGTVPEQYLYMVGETVYLSTRRDFWQMSGEADKGFSHSIGPPNSTCWVNPSNPREVVHFLDAPRNWSNATGRIAACGLILATVTGFLWADGRRRRARSEGQV